MQKIKCQREGALISIEIEKLFKKTRLKKGQNKKMKEEEERACTSCPREGLFFKNKFNCHPNIF